MSEGYLYVANRPKLLSEAKISARSLRRFTDRPITIILSESINDITLRDVFDQITVIPGIEQYSYWAKIIGIRNSPYEKTVFLDCDTFICADISELFDILDIVDFATTQEATKHTGQLKGIRYKNILPEFNTGVMVFKKSDHIKKLFDDWLNVCISQSIIFDMPGFREAVIENFDKLHYSILPEEYNTHGFRSMIILYDNIKIIHERLDNRWRTLTRYFLSYDRMQRFAERINKKKEKRLYLPYLGVIPNTWNLNNLFYKIKKTFGVKRTSKYFSN